jgi:hypothetical protein
LFSLEYTRVKPLDANESHCAPESPHREVILAWINAFNAGDVGGITSLYSQQAVLWGTFARRLITEPDERRDYFVRALGSKPAPQVALDSLHVQPSHDFAIASGTYSLSVLVDGCLRIMPARFTFVLRPLNQTWLIINHHSSLLPNV